MTESEIEALVSKVLNPLKDFCPMVEAEGGKTIPKCDCYGRLGAAIRSRLLVPASELMTEEQIIDVINDTVFGVASDGDYGKTGVEEAAKALVGKVAVKK